MKEKDIEIDRKRKVEGLKERVREKERGNKRERMREKDIEI